MRSISREKEMGEVCKPVGLLSGLRNWLLNLTLDLEPQNAHNERTDACKMSSVLHVHTMEYACTHHTTHCGACVHSPYTHTLTMEHVCTHHTHMHVHGARVHSPYTRSPWSTCALTIHSHAHCGARVHSPHTHMLTMDHMCTHHTCTFTHKKLKQRPKKREPKGLVRCQSAYPACTRAEK